MNGIFLDITLVLILATALGMLAKWLRQPTILGYLAAGILIGPLGLVEISNTEVLDAFAEIGITLLLFLVGMEMRLRELRYIGKPALLTGIGQIVFTSLIGYLITRLLGYSTLSALYIALALTFSSTIIVVKLLSEKHVLDSLHGKLVVGFLLVQDFVALLALIMITSLTPEVGVTGQLPLAVLSITVLKALILFGIVLLLGKYVIPRLLHTIGHSQEMLLLSSLAWGLGLAALVTIPQIGFSIEIGGFLAGIALADSIEHFQISSRIKSLRDFFIVIFFTVLGLKLALSNLTAIWFPTLILTAFVLIGNPLIVMLILGLMGYRSRTSFLASVTVAQISEFSLILVALGHRLGHLDETAVSLVTAVGIITITLSSYLIIHGERLYDRYRHVLRVFEFRDLRLGTDERQTAPKDGHIVLVGCDRMGSSILHSLKELHRDVTVIDFNPDVINRLMDRKIDAVYGDISDPDIQESAGLAKAKLVISTVPGFDDSINLLEFMKGHNPKAKIILTTEREHDAIRLYRAGAYYVLLPHFIGGLQLAHTMEDDPTLRSLRRQRNQDLEILARRI